MAINLFKTKLIPEDQIVYIYDLVKNIIAPGNRAFISPQLQLIIDDVLDSKLPEGWRLDSGFIDKLNKSFRNKQFSTYDEKYFPEYYAGYYLPNNLYKIQLMMLELFRLGRISFSEKKIRVVDLGAAVGTTAWALYDFYDILANVLQLYGLKDEKLPALEVDSIERSTSNIEFFEEIRGRVNNIQSKVIVNSPINDDVLTECLYHIDVKSYDIIVASNIINEFPAYSDRLEFTKRIIADLGESSSFVLIETAFLNDTRDLKRIQQEVSAIEGVQVISPCGKINGYSNRCSDCWSFRRESLRIPDTMKLFNKSINESDENEKLKWSYTIYAKDKTELFPVSIKTPSLNDISSKHDGEPVTVTVEIVSGRIYDEIEKEYYYIKVCDQSEVSEGVILKVPKYFELPKYQYGDIIEIQNGILEKLSTKKMRTVQNAILLDPKTTTVKNLSVLEEQKGLVSFSNIQEDNIKYFLWRFFGFNEFNEGQFEILQKVLQNENVLGILATGGGKSLTFQLPALLKPGVSIIVSPLKSLMDDQVNGLKNRFGFDFVDRIHSGMLLHEKRQVFDRFRNGHLKILYIAPERLQQKTFQKELTNLIDKGININYFPIDEAHCISEWGHDFRPSYARLKDRQQDLPHVDGNVPPIIALTATASQKVQEDILDQLKMNSTDDLIHRIIDRTELSLEVIPLEYSTNDRKYKIRFRDPVDPNTFSEFTFPSGLMRHDILLHVMKEILPKRFDEFDINDAAGLIFTIYADPMPAKDMEDFRSDKSREREGAFWLSEFLNENGIGCLPWFSALGFRKGQTQEEKRQLQKDWEVQKVNTQNDYIDNRVNLLVTTKGFGMGIDKPNIRYIVHYGFPGSLESYFQQIGRAGRDRSHSHCILIWDMPTEECKNNLELLHVQNRDTVPECFKINPENLKYNYTGCPYGREWKCDYAKQIFFIESGYPTIEEMQETVDYLVSKSKDQDCYPWVYLKTQYIRDAIARKLGYRGRDHDQLNEQLLVETLYTLKYIEEFSQTYLEVGIKRSVTLGEIYNSTNSEIVKEHIDLLEKIYPQIKNSPPTNASYAAFDISNYVKNIREKFNVEILIDEVVQFFNILNERDDFDLKFNYYKDFGFEIKLNRNMLKTKIDQAEHLNKIVDWKKSQYAMLKNMIDYADLESFSSESDHAKCRRVHIMQVFGTESASDTIRCNYCDNCGYNNPWDQKADDVTADESEQSFAANLDSFFNNQSKDIHYLEMEIKQFFNLVTTMLKQNYNSLAETKSEAWLEQIGETENAATNLMLSLISYHNGDSAIFKNRFNNFLNFAGDNDKFLQSTFILMIESIGIEAKEIFYMFFDEKEKNELQKALKIFSSVFSYNFIDVENEIGLRIVELQADELSTVYNSYERLIGDG